MDNITEIMLTRLWDELLSSITDDFSGFRECFTMTVNDVTLGTRYHNTIKRDYDSRFRKRRRNA